MLIFFRLILIFLLVSLIKCHLNYSDAFLQSTFNQSQIYFYNKGITNLIWNLIAKNKSISISGSCESTLTKALLRNYHLKYQQLSGQFPKQFRRESYADFGDYDSCLQLKDDDNNDAKYCLISLLPAFNELIKLKIIKEKDQLFDVELSGIFGQSIHVGICIPSSCSSQDLSNLVDSVIHNFYWTQDQHPPHCVYKQTKLEFIKSATISQKLCLLIITLLVVTVVYAGLMDIVCWMKNSDDDKNTPNHTIHSFFSPLKSFHSISQVVRRERLIILDQIRLTLYIIVFGLHIPIWPTTYSGFYLVHNYKYVREFVAHFYTQPMINFSFLECLFMIGGFSSAIQIWLKLRSNNSINACLQLIVDRFMRFQPLILASIALEIILPLLGSGPAYSSLTEKKSQVCTDNYYYTILHIANLLPADQICQQPLWSISAEFHLFIWIVLVMFVYLKNDKIGTILAHILLLISFVYRLSIFAQDDIIPLNTITPIKMSEMNTYYNKYYLRSLPRLSTYMWMVCLFIQIMRPTNWQFAEIFMKWRTILTLFAINSYGSSLFNYWHIKPTILVNVLYHLVFDTINAFAFTCIILRHKNAIKKVLLNLQQTNGNNNVGETISNNQQRLTSPPGKVDILLRLSRNCYFIHSPVLIWYYSSYRKSVEWWSSEAVNGCLIMFLLIYVFTLPFHILVYSPYERIYGALRKKMFHLEREPKCKLL